VIISCPECEGPFEVRDGDVAPLVKLACPHCRFEMILDFEAANDGNLVEAGHRFANGWTTEAEYRQAAGAEVPVTAPTPAPAPTPGATPGPAAAPARPATAPTTPATPAPAARAPAPASAPTPAAAEPAPARPAPATPPARTVSAPAPGKRTIIAGSAVPPPQPTDADRARAKVPRAARETRPDPGIEDETLEQSGDDIDIDTDEVAAAAARASAMLDEELAEEGSPEDSMARVASQPLDIGPPKGPPHTPPGAASSAPPEERAAGARGASPSPAELSSSSGEAPDEERRPRGLKRALMFLFLGLLLVVILLGALGYAETGDPDPLPVLDALLREHLGVSLPI
jgi:hypothetical protein